MENKIVSMVGMPGSGKTTFLANICNMLIDGGVDTKLTARVDELPTLSDTLEECGEKLLAGQSFERTPTEVKYKVKINLYNSQGEKYIFEIPDCSGEKYRDLVQDRQIDENFVIQFRDSDSILFFVNYFNMSKEELIKVENKEQKAEEISGEDSVEKNREANESQIVELLQLIIEFIKGYRRPKIKVIISAWDIIAQSEEQYNIPSDFLVKKLPLLNQYLICNKTDIDYDVWGISAQGGDFECEEQRRRIQLQGFDSIIVVDPKGNQSNDLTAVLV